MKLFLEIVVLSAMVSLWPFLLAKLDLFFTFIKEGEAKIVARGETYCKTIFALKGHRIKRNGDIEQLPPGASEPTKWFWEKYFGVSWVGLPPFQKIYSYRLRWTSYKPTGRSGEKAPEVNDETLSSVFIKDKVYFGLIQDVETIEGIPLRVEFLATLRVVNPYKAVFLISNWVETVIDRISQQGRVYIGNKTYKELQTGETSDPDQGFSGFLLHAGPGVTSLADTILETYGVKFVSCDILKQDPPDSYRETTTRAYTAQQNADALRIDAEGKAKAIELVGQAEAGVIVAKGNAEAESIRKRNEAIIEHPEAAKLVLETEVGKAQGIGNIAKSIVEALRR